MKPNSITFLIKTFERPRDCGKLIASVLKKYPGQPIHVVDDSSDPADWSSFGEQVKVIESGYDEGVSKGRNKLFDSVETPVYMLLDDDYIFDERTNVEKLLFVLDQGYDYVCGTVNREFVFDWCGNLIYREDGVLEISKRVKWRRKEGVSWCEVDVAPNVYVGRAGGPMRYTERWKIGCEHIDWATRAKEQGVKTAYVPEVSVIHSRNRPRGYRKMRMRGGMMNRRWREENGVRAFAKGKLPMHNRNPIFVLTPGSCGSRLLTDYFEVLGWVCPGKDEYGEPPLLREFNKRIVAGHNPSLEEYISTLPPGWLLKDPYISKHPSVWQYWKEYLESEQVTVILNMRSKDSHDASMMNRWNVPPKSSAKRRRACRRYYDSYMGPKYQMDYEHMQKIAALWSR